MIEHEYDPETGIVTSRSSGLLTVADIEGSTRAIRAFAAKARAKFGRALLLVDARQSIVQPRDVMEAVERDGSHLSHPADKQAIVVPTALSMIQSRRLFGAPNEQAVQSMDEALAWLRAD